MDKACQLDGGGAFCSRVRLNFGRFLCLGVDELRYVRKMFLFLIVDWAEKIKMMYF